MNDDDTITTDLGFDNGRDELNLAELPYFINNQRSGCKTIKYSSTIIDPKTNKRIPRSLTITAGDENGMPNALCGKVILGALQFDLGGDHSDTTTFRFRALAKAVGIDTGAQGLDRIKLALHRYVATTLRYENSWFDRRNQEWTSQSFHIIESLKVGEDGVEIRWGREFLISLQEGYLKPLDLKIFRSLKSSHSEILFRYLDKKFYRRKECDFLFSDLCYNHLGFDKKVEVRELKRRLKKPLEELEAHCFIARDPKRFYKSRGEWRVKFRKPTLLDDADQPLLIADEDLLDARFYGVGFSREQVEELKNKYDRDRLEKQLEHVLYRRTVKSIKNLVPYFLKVVEDNPELPKDMTTEAERTRLELERTQKRREESILEAQKRAQTDKEWEETDLRVNTFLNSLDEEEREKILKLKRFANYKVGTNLWMMEVENYIEENAPIPV